MLSLLVAASAANGSVPVGGRVAFGAGREQLALVQDRSAALVDLEVTPDGTWREAAPRGAAGDGAASQADVWPALWRRP
jgi:hypothetical protein